MTNTKQITSQEAEAQQRVSSLTDVLVSYSRGSRTYTATSLEAAYRKACEDSCCYRASGSHNGQTNGLGDLILYAALEFAEGEDLYDYYADDLIWDEDISGLASAGLIDVTCTDGSYTIDCIDELVSVTEEVASLLVPIEGEE